MTPKDIENASKDAQTVVDELIYLHRSAAIPALIGACVLWAVENGGGDVVRASLNNAIKMSHAMERERKKGTN